MTGFNSFTLLSVYLEMEKEKKMDGLKRLTAASLEESCISLFQKYNFMAGAVQMLSTESREEHA